MTTPVTTRATRRWTAAFAWLAPASLLIGCHDSVADGFYGPDTDAADDAALMPAATTTGASDDVASSPSPEGGGSGASAKPSGPCDLTGRWIATVRTVTTALNTEEAAHTWYYFQITQSGSAVTIAKGLVCGKNVRALSAVGGNSDFPKAWPAMQAQISYTGHKGTSASASGGCQVSFDKTEEVMSATEAYYADVSHALPGMSDQASGSAPGWLDWDNDGQPGYSMSITGLATGQIYMVDRTTYTLSGEIAASASTFKLAVDWDSEQDVLGIDGPPILSMTASAVKDGDASLHFATFARLSDSQATGDDDAVCSAIRMLAPTLTPDADN
ncbi:MAG TPA: hypothetical protein VHV30_17395 [Polyangiaceae bacterium]|jgi:hypothetical protein|nr:hypothetical protein [Polyangiaceae bacterium]